MDPYDFVISVPTDDDTEIPDWYEELDDENLNSFREVCRLYNDDRCRVNENYRPYQTKGLFSLVLNHSLFIVQKIPSGLLGLYV